MSEFARPYVPLTPENVKVGAWVLCADCSKGVHTTYHSQINPCACDLCRSDDA